MSLIILSKKLSKTCELLFCGTVRLLMSEIPSRNMICATGCPEKKQSFYSTIPWQAEQVQLPLPSKNIHSF